jgi:predicted extracellular nuclease
MSASSRHVALIAGLGLAAGTLVLLPAPAHALGPGLVINEIYSGGNGASSAFQNDFVELRNTSTDPISLLGKSIQIRNNTGVGTVSASNVFALPDVELAPGQTFLVAGAGGGAGAALPTPDATSSLNPSTNAGQVFLASTTDPLDPNVPAGGAGSAFSGQVIDFVGWGSTATSFEGSAPGPGSGAGGGVTRDVDGTDTDDNRLDLAGAAPPTPLACGCAYVPETLTATIPEVQGSGGTSPLLYDTVTTQGNVTAVYPAGGLNGFFLQSPGEGVAGASDAVFVALGGSIPNNAYPAVNESVQVTGVVSEVAGLTQISVVAAADVVDLTGLAATTVFDAPWTSIDTAAEREVHEGELIEPQGAFTVTDVSRMHADGTIGLAQGTTPLAQPTDVAAPGPDADTVAASNAARRITIDDGATTNYAPNTTNPSSQGTALPWLTATHSVRVGAGATFEQPMVLDHREGGWRFQPTARVTGLGDAVASFTDTRVQNDVPRALPGNASLANFDLSGFFTTTGEAYVAGDPTNRSCVYTVDRDGVANKVTSCNPSGLAGAANAASLSRQQQKVVEAINGLGASIVGLQGIENSARFDGSRDDAIEALVTALNADAGAGTWGYVPSPTNPPGGEGVVVNALVFRTADVRTVGESSVQDDQATFGDAAVPLAQAFAAVDAPDDDAFTVVVGEFSSRDAGADDGSGQGLGNTERLDQAAALGAFADDVATANGTAAVFLMGNLNAYRMEAPVQSLVSSGYDLVDTSGEPTAVGDGQAGALDHVLVNTAAAALVTDADVWDINAGEAVAYHYSRNNANITPLVDAASPFASSTNNPVLVGLDISSDPQVAETELALTASPAKIAAGSGKTTLMVTVSSIAGVPTGEVTATVGGQTTAPKALSGGKAQLTVGPFTTTGSRSVLVSFSGAPGFGASQRTVQVQVVKALPTLKVTKTPRKVVAKKTRAKLAVNVTGSGLLATGKVTAKLGRRVLAAGNLSTGKLTLTLPKFKKPGRAAVMVTYSGNAGLEKVSKKLVIKVKPKR